MLTTRNLAHSIERAPWEQMRNTSIGGSVSRRQMSDQAVYKLLEKRREQALFPPLSPHDFRRA